MPDSTADAELEAIRTILSALGGLEEDPRQRVLRYVLNRLDITPAGSASEISRPAVAAPDRVVRHAPQLVSIRDLKEEKRPESANQMAALVAYYLAEVLEGDERKESVNTSELEKYFKQAAFKLPKTLAQTLPNAAAAGYFDSLGEGRYKLTPVGYNLVVHGLPRAHSSSESVTRKPAPARSKK